MRFEDADRLVGVARLINREASAFDEIDGIRPDQKLVFHNQYADCYRALTFGRTDRSVLLKDTAEKCLRSLVAGQMSHQRAEPAEGRSDRSTNWETKKGRKEVVPAWLKLFGLQRQLAAQPFQPPVESQIGVRVAPNHTFHHAHADPLSCRWCNVRAA